jgi:hypothetical protein
MPREVHIPVRRDELIALARATREKYRFLTLDEIAEAENIVLVRMPDPSASSGGFAYTEILEEHGERVAVDSIVMNPKYKNSDGELVSEEQIFWHEFYHLWYSPSRIDTVADFYEYSTHNVLHSQEERRAEEFTAAVLIHSIGARDTIASIQERYGITSALAEIGLKLLGGRL